VGFVLAGANATTQYLKPALAISRPSTDVDAASWPSGHSTAAMALALCLIYAAPALARIPAALVGVLTAFAVGGSVVILGWHFPSDAIGGYLVAGCFMCIALAGLALSRPAATTAPRRRWRLARG
jgi:membrane-associated phospholipid phosphatase